MNSIPQKRQSADSQAEYHIQFFKALAHPTRLSIVQLLKQGELCVCDIEKELQGDLSTISRHLTQLKNAHIVTDERMGKRVVYKLKAECVLPFLQCINANHPEFKASCK